MPTNKTILKNCKIIVQNGITPDEAHIIASETEKRITKQVVSLIKSLNQKLNNIEELLKK